MRLLIVIAFLTMLIDGADLAVMPLAIPHIAADLGIAAASFGTSLAAMPLGFGVGALLIGPAGDRFGRRILIATSLLAVGVATAATAASHSLTDFAVLRLVTGAGLGSTLPNLNALLADNIRRGMKATALTIAGCGIPVGAAACGFFMPAVITRLNWPGSFVLLGSVTAVIAILCWFLLPESRSLAHSVRTGSGPFSRARGSFDWSMLKLLRRDFRLTSFTFIGLYTINAFCLYLLSAWLPTILPRAGIAVDEAARLTGIMQVGGLVGGLIISRLLDHSAAARALGASYALVVIALLGLVFVAPGFLHWGLLLFVVGGGISGAHLAIIALGSILYPPAMTASALGLGVAVARLGAIGGPLCGQFLLQRGLGPSSLFASLLIPICLCIGFVSLIPLIDPQRATSPAVNR